MYAQLVLHVVMEVFRRALPLFVMHQACKGVERELNKCRVEPRKERQIHAKRMDVCEDLQTGKIRVTLWAEVDGVSHCWVFFVMKWKYGGVQIFLDEEHGREITYGQRSNAI